MNLEKIRERIHYYGAFEPTYSVLKELQHQFLLHVPFENLDIHLNIPLDYSSENVYSKIVERNRGGVCYENNSLFFDILKAIGFNVNFISGEMFKGLPLKNDEEHKHMALTVTIENEIYLVDVGNGKSFGNPLPINNKAFSKGEDFNYIVDDYEEIKALYYKDSNGDLTPRYVFDISPKTRADFKKACNYIETSPESVFRKNTLASLYQKEGRITFSGHNLKTSNGILPSSVALPSKEAYGKMLKTLLGISLSDSELQTLELKSSVSIV